MNRNRITRFSASIAALVILSSVVLCFDSVRVHGNTNDEQPAEKDDAKKPPDFVGIELGPGITSAINDGARKDDWSQREIDAYYQVLDFARKTDYAKQKAKARENIRTEIERQRVQVIERCEQRLKAIDKKAEELGTLQAARQRTFARQRRDHELKQLDQYEKDPSEYPFYGRLMASMVHSFNKRQTSEYHGKLVTLRGNVRKLITYKAHDNVAGIERLYEAWLYPKGTSIYQKDDPRKNPVVVIFTKLPKGMPTGDKISEPVSVTGYVFRLYRYTSDEAEGKTRVTPMILASTIEWQPPAPPARFPTWARVLILSGIVLILVAVFYFGRRDKAAHKKQVDELLTESDDTDQLPSPGA